MVLPFRVMVLPFRVMVLPFRVADGVRLHLFIARNLTRRRLLSPSLPKQHPHDRRDADWKLPRQRDSRQRHPWCAASSLPPPETNTFGQHPHRERYRFLFPSLPSREARGRSVGWLGPAGQGWGEMAHSSVLTSVRGDENTCNMDSSDVEIFSIRRTVPCVQMAIRRKTCVRIQEFRQERAPHRCQPAVAEEQFERSPLCKHRMFERVHAR